MAGVGAKKQAKPRGAPSLCSVQRQPHAKESYSRLDEETFSLDRPPLLSNATRVAELQLGSSLLDRVPGRRKPSGSLAKQHLAVPSADVAAKSWLKTSGAERLEVFPRRQPGDAD